MGFLFRRWVEFVILAFAVCALLKGSHLPPPVARTLVVKGPIRNLELGTGYATFVVGSTSFESNHYEPGYLKLRQVLKDGALAEVVSWPGGSWPDDESVALGISIDGVQAVSPGSRLASSWLFSMISIVAGIGSAWAAIYTFRRPSSAWENYRAIQKKKQDAQTATHKQRRV
jgi:hypothetical protein